MLWREVIFWRNPLVCYFYSLYYDLTFFLLLYLHIVPKYFMYTLIGNLFGLFNVLKICFEKFWATMASQMNILLWLLENSDWLNRSDLKGKPCSFVANINNLNLSQFWILIYSRQSLIVSLLKFNYKSIIILSKEC